MSNVDKTEKAASTSRRPPPPHLYPGRDLHFWPGVGDPLHKRSQGRPLAAKVAFVHSPTSVNLAVLDNVGCPHQRLAVRLVLPGEASPGDGVSYCEWPQVCTV
jgi:hypothetical protein